MNTMIKCGKVVAVGFGDGGNTFFFVIKEGKKQYNYTGPEKIQNVVLNAYAHKFTLTAYGRKNQTQDVVTHYAKEDGEGQKTTMHVIDGVRVGNL